MKAKSRYLILFLLVILPFFFPFSSRYGYEIPIAFPEQHWDAIILVILFCFFGILAYWCLVGHLFARWVGSFGRSFFLGNLPVFFNFCGELIYFVLLGKEAADMPAAAYLVGSHIDKINLFPFSPAAVDILIDTAAMLALFTCGYELKKRHINDLSRSGPFLSKKRREKEARR